MPTTIQSKSIPPPFFCFHLFEFKNKQTKKIDRKVVAFLGAYVQPLLIQTPDTQVTLIDSIWQHPLFNTADLTYDFALLKMAYPIRENPEFRSICLPTSKEQCERQCFQEEEEEE